MKIICVGECTVDHYLDLEQHYVGGISLNFAVHSKRCGAQHVSLISCVGTDAAGVRALAKLNHEGVDASHTIVLAGETARQDIRLVKGGERIFPPGGFQPGVLAHYQLREKDLAFLQGHQEHDILAAPLYSQVEAIFNKAIRESGFPGKRVADFLDASDYSAVYSQVENYRPDLDLIFISGTRATAETLLPLSLSYQGLIVVTLGAEGSIALANGTKIYQPALKVTAPVDSTGCGDAFQAAFTLTYFQSGNIQKALYRGAKQAAHVLQHYGAV